MPTHTSYLAIVIFLAFVGFTLGLSFWLGRKAKSAGGYFAAHGEIGWFVNGIAFAGDYLSAASFLGICGMIAFYGYDGFLYSIGFLAGWVVALFVIAEPIKRLGRYTFADALDAKFNSRGIRLAAAISTLVVSMFYLIPQMVGAGSLIKPLLALPDFPWHGIDLTHALGVGIVGGVVILIVTTAGMVSTTWVQFIKGSLLVIFCAGLVVAILVRGVNSVRPLDPQLKKDWKQETSAEHLAQSQNAKLNFNFWPKNANVIVSDSKTSDDLKKVFDAPLPWHSSGPLGPIGFISSMEQATVAKSGPPHAGFEMNRLGVYTPDYIREVTFKQQMLTPGNYYVGLRSSDLFKKLDFISLMLALFCGTASLPHILIRYYTVKDAAAARKSTVVGIAAIGFFYVLTLYIGLGAMVSGNLDPKDSNMAAPLLARTFGELPFALITAIAFTTVLGTVSGLILASAGAIAHDLASVFVPGKLEGSQQVKVAKIASVGVGLIAIVLGILFQKFNVTFLVGWAFNVAASANLPAIVMLLFWGRTTKQGMIASILVGCFGSVAWLLLTKEAFVNVYGQAGHLGYVPFSQPGLVTIPLSFVVLVLVSLVTKRREPRGFDVVRAA